MPVVLAVRYNGPEALVALPLLGRTGNLVGVVCNFFGPGHAMPSPERMALVQAFAGAAAVALGAHLSGELDGAAEQQELFGQRGLAGVRVGDDGEGAPARHFLFERVGHGKPDV